MIIPSNNKLIVSVDFSQKASTQVGNSQILLAKSFSHNRRESNPVTCQVVEGNEYVPRGRILLVHHNRFVENSPHHLGDNLYSLAYNNSIFGWIDENGTPHQMCGNIFVEYVYDNNNPLTPDNLKVANENKYKVISTGYGFKKGQFVFAYNQADYEIVYNFNGIERHVVKLVSNDIVGKIINK